MSDPGAVDPHGMGSGLWQAIFAGGTFLLSIFGAAIGVTLRLAGQREKLNDKIGDLKLEFNQRIKNEIDIAVNQFGETMRAQQRKMTDMELWNRDTFVDKATFVLFMSDTKNWQQRFEDKLDDRFDRIEAKLDDRSR